jgi:membrane fusion protein (multidrug efflux system)
MKTRLAKHVVRAPYPGRLGLRKVDLGDYVEPGDPIVEISDTTALELRFALPQRHISELAKGQKVLGIVGRCGPRFEGQVIAIDPRVDPMTRMVGIRAAVANDLGLLHPGMAVRTRLIVGEHKDALVVPQEAIVREGTKHFVYVVSPENLVDSRPVRVGEYFVDGVRILGGLEEGERIVVAGHQKLGPGSKVVPNTEPVDAIVNPVVSVGRTTREGCDAL